jgi:hypothetical protein
MRFPLHSAELGWRQVAGCSEHFDLTGHKRGKQAAPIGLPVQSNVRPAGLLNAEVIR